MVEIGDDILDSRDVQSRINELEGLDELDEDDKEELAKLTELKEQIDDSVEWEDGIILIHDQYFADYARELAEDIGAINSDAKWPATCIDWEQAARELQMDFTNVEVDEHTYWYR